MFLKKMSTKNMGCSTHPVKKLAHGTVVPLAVIGGVATDIKTGENRTTGEPWSSLQGNFQGVNIQAGVPSLGPDGVQLKDDKGTPLFVGRSEDFEKVYESGTLFLPGGIQEYLESAVRAAQGGSVEFAVKISAVTDDSVDNQFGFKYQVENLKKPAAQDSLAGVRTLMQSHTSAVLAIAPPEEQAKEERKPVEPNADSPAEPPKVATTGGGRRTR